MIAVAETNYGEVWQNQRYWPIKGWDEATGMQFSSLNGGKVSHTFPHVILPNGWEWCGPWEVDVSKRFGDCDDEGFVYAASFERLLDMIRNKCTMGAPSAASIVRRRCYIRPKRCITPVAKQQLVQSVNKLVDKRHVLESNARNKRFELAILVSFEKRRLQVFGELSDSCHTANANAIELIRLLARKLASLKQSLLDRAAIELEYAKRLELLCHQHQERNSEELVSISSYVSNMQTGDRKRSSTVSGPVAEGEGNGNGTGGSPASPPAPSSEEEVDQPLVLQSLHQYDFDGMVFAGEPLMLLDATNNANNTSNTSKLLTSFGLRSNSNATPMGSGGHSTGSSVDETSTVGTATPETSEGNSNIADLSQDATSLDMSVPKLNITGGFFDLVSHANKLLSVAHSAFGKSIQEDAFIHEISSMIFVLHEMLKKHTAESKKMSENFRVSEDCLRKCFKQTQSTYAYVAKCLESLLHENQLSIRSAAKEGGDCVWTETQDQSSNGAEREGEGEEQRLDTAAEVGLLPAQPAARESYDSAGGPVYDDEGDHLEDTFHMDSPGAKTNDTAVDDVAETNGSTIATPNSPTPTSPIPANGATASLESSQPAAGAVTPTLASASARAKRLSGLAFSFASSVVNKVRDGSNASGSSAGGEVGGSGAIAGNHPAHSPATSLTSSSTPASSGITSAAHNLPPPIPYDVWYAFQTYRWNVQQTTENLRIVYQCSKRNMRSSAMCTEKAKELFSTTAARCRSGQLSVWQEQICMSVLEGSTVVTTGTSTSKENEEALACFTTNVASYQHLNDILVNAFQLPQLPNCTATAIQGAVSSASFIEWSMVQNESSVQALLWTPYFAQVTTDGYLHLHKKATEASDPFQSPVKSYFLMQFKVEAAAKMIVHQEQSHPFTLVLKPAIAPSTGINAANSKQRQTVPTDGLVVQYQLEEDYHKWFDILSDPFGCSPMGQEAMMAEGSLPAETAARTFTMDEAEDLFFGDAEVAVEKAGSGHVDSDDDDVEKDAVCADGVGLSEDHMVVVEKDDATSDGKAVTLHTTFTNTTIMHNNSSAGVVIDSACDADPQGAASSPSTASTEKANAADTTPPTDASSPQPSTAYKATNPNAVPDTSWIVIGGGKNGLTPVSQPTSSYVPPKQPIYSLSRANSGVNAVSIGSTAGNSVRTTSPIPYTPASGTNSPNSGEGANEEVIMSRRRSAKIEQYEKGVKAMRDAEANRVAATKGKTLASFGIKPQPAGNAPV